MSEQARLAAARDALRIRLEAVVGSGPIPRLDEALTHPSYANEKRERDYQRLEFLGDAVLGLCVSEMLSIAYPEADEGQLTRMRSALVNGEALAAWARRLELGACVALGRGATLGTEREQTKVLADAAEALLAAVYEARGLEGTRSLVREAFGELLAKAAALTMLDPKSELQQRVQAVGQSAPTYRVVDVRGAPHDQAFEVEVLVGDHPMARGEGRSKRLAERAAALAALELLDKRQQTA